MCRYAFNKHKNTLFLDSYSLVLCYCLPIQTTSRCHINYSWGVGCGRPGNPGVYASVAYHFDWLVNHICDGPDLDSNAASWCFESAQNSGRTSATISNNATALTNTNYTFSANDDESSFNETTTPSTTPIPTLSASTITPTIEPSDLFTGIPSSNPSHQPSLPPSPSPKDNNSNEKGANKNNNRSEEDRLFYSTAALPQIHLERTTTSANIRRNGGGGTIGISSSGIHPNESTEAVTTTATTRLGRARGVRKKDWNNHHSRKQRHKGNVRGSHRLL